ncbi:UDP-3-O-(3-hydroxymyristoyl)glucosamine N-acyltransferase [Suttonella sp. R2A3]|uniref:UDP-3-O-(3-hydroxymyristoyl)glucosamine N-acyltransferase n=1 Tax=Suttonella sp. R2A3 TaxID=2908648 RepID=UPI001F2D1382|nr:UDP-3-O-(3-hydroxymyristoyl)glucosamine N-acyltransferase [Suttonella sp. R2A3]UJF24824.1 UDP-3-O-(3-hydroxymyristoyl)glucosamine N-acyltransferase [Suttonella sp. R2A3]
MSQKKLLSVHDIAQALGAHVIGDEKRQITGAGTLEHGQQQQVGFLAERQYQRYIDDCQLGAVLVQAPFDDIVPAQIVVDDVKAAWRTVADLFSTAPVASGIDARAVIAEDAEVAENVSIAAGAVIGSGAKIGASCVIGSGVVIEPGVSIGRDGTIIAGARILAGTQIGARVFIDSGAVIGSRGFGYALENGHWHAIAQLGGVRIGDDVDIGANTTIDRGAIEDTVLEDGVKLDNLIQIGHNVHIGAHTIIAGACVIAGSVRFGTHCVVGGASVFAGHIQIADGCQFTGHSSVSKSITKSGVYCSALTVMPIRQWKRFVAKLKIFGKEK